MKSKTQNILIEDVIDQIGVGIVQFFLTFAVGLATLVGSCQLTSLPFVLDGIEHRIPVTSTEKGILSGVTYGGSLVAHVVAGNVADCYGRKNTSLLMFLLCITMSMLQGIVSSVGQLLIVRLILGISVGSLETASRPLVAELAPSKYRSYFLSTCHLSFELGFCASVVFAWMFLKNYGIQGYLFAVNSPLAIAMLLFCFFAVETPQFYMLKRDRVKVEESLKKIAYMNCRQLSDEDFLGICYKKKLSDDETHQLTACQLISRVLRTTFSIFEKPYTGYAYAFLTTSVSLTVAIRGILNWMPLLFKDLQEIFLNKYLQVVLIDISVFPAIWLSVPLLDLLGRRVVGCLSCIGAGIAVWVFYLVPKNGLIPIIALMVDRGLVSVASNCTQVAAVEAYPAKMRGTAIGLVLSMFKIGTAISACLFPIMVNYWVYLPVLFSIGFLFQTAFFTTLWPETNKRKLKISQSYSIIQENNSQQIDDDEDEFESVLTDVEEPLIRP